MIIRTAVSNNFNFSAAELEQLKTFDRPDRKVFVNSNAFTRITADRPSFVTLNPYLEPVKLKGDTSAVKALRVKVWLRDGSMASDAIDALAMARDYGIPVLLTLQRFSSKAEADRYTLTREGYVFDAGYYRPDKAAQKLLIDTARKIAPGAYVCDEAGTGCPTCGNCARLSFGVDEDVASLNLSASGQCKYNCPSCFAKRNAARAGGKIAFDRVLKNRKQKGETKHI